MRVVDSEFSMKFVWPGSALLTLLDTRRHGRNNRHFSWHAMSYSSHHNEGVQMFPVLFVECCTFESSR